MKNSKNQFKANEQALINDILTNGRQNRQWSDLAIQYNIRPNGDIVQRRKSANDVWRRYNRITNIDVTPRATAVFLPNPPIQLLQPIKPKRLFYDIETSYNIVKSWRVGYNLSINPEDIIQERAIITVTYKWEGEEEITVLSWDKGDDEALVKDFVKVMAEADELVGHNVDRFDTKFIMGRALKHGIPVLPKYQSTDTLKLARKHFMLNSNKLDYIGQFLGLGSKVKHRGMAMWDDIIQKNCPKALEEMIEYNIQDVILTEQVYKKLVDYSLPKVNHTSKQTGEKHSCPECGSMEAKLEKTYVTPAGAKTRLMHCTCGTRFTVNNSNYEKYYGGVKK